VEYEKVRKISASPVPAGKISTLRSIPANIHRTPPPFAGTRFVHDNPRQVGSPQSQGDSDRPTDGYDTSTVAKRLDLFFAELAIDRFHLAASFKFYQAVPESMEQNRELAANQFSFPILAIGGERGSTPNIGQDISPIAPHARSLLFPCGHYVPEEQPERLVDELREFFKAGR
jgi:pimeloyl-ACP methyl ester carboxylesterase